MNAMTPNDIFQQANEKLETNDFVAAIELYRIGAMNSEPSESQLANLAIAESEDQLSFRRELCRLHPNSLICKMHLILRLSVAGRAASAVGLASSLIADGQLDQKHVLLVRLHRFKNAVTSDRHESVVEDFLQIWHAEKTFPVTLRFRVVLVEAIASCRNPSLASVFEEISRALDADDPAIPFLQQKVIELRSLADLTHLLRSRFHRVGFAAEKMGEFEEQ